MQDRNIKNNEQIAPMMDTKLHETRITVNIEIPGKIASLLEMSTSENIWNKINKK